MQKKSTYSYKDTCFFTQQLQVPNNNKYGAYTFVQSFRIFVGNFKTFEKYVNYENPLLSWSRVIGR